MFVMITILFLYNNAQILSIHLGSAKQHLYDIYLHIFDNIYFAGKITENKKESEK